MILTSYIKTLYLEFIFTACSELHKVLFLALSVTFLFVFCLYMKYLRELMNRFVPNSHGRRVCSLAQASMKVKVKGQDHQGQISSPMKMHYTALTANTVMQQQMGPFCRCRG